MAVSTSDLWRTIWFWFLSNAIRLMNWAKASTNHRKTHQLYITANALTFTVHSLVFSYEITSDCITVSQPTIGRNITFSVGWTRRWLTRRPVGSNRFISKPLSIHTDDTTFGILSQNTVTQKTTFINYKLNFPKNPVYNSFFFSQRLTVINKMWTYKTTIRTNFKEFIHNFF